MWRERVDQEIQEKTPKSLILLNKKPILEYIIQNLIKNGFDEIHISGYYKFLKYIIILKNLKIKI